MEFIDSSNISTNGEMKSTRDGCSEALMSIGESDNRVIVLTADLPDSTRTIAFSKAYPERFFNVGVAEQNMAGLSAGLALSGKIPFIASFGVFSPGRNWDQIRVSICYSKANVKIISSHTGLGVGEDGASHQALEDIAISRVIPNLVVIAPADYYDMEKAIIAAKEWDGPVYIRYGRQAVKTYTTDSTPFSIGVALQLTTGSDITIASTGTMLERAVEASEMLEKDGISAEIIHFATVKPLDSSAILGSVQKTGCIVTVEDHQIIGGFGSAVCEVLSKSLPTPVEMVGMQDQFGQSGPFQELYPIYHMDAQAIYDKAKIALSRKRI